MSIGKGEENEKIQITQNISYQPDYTKATLILNIVYEEEIESIQINGTNIEIPQKVNGKYEVIQDILENGNYIVFVKDTNGGYKIEVASSTQISEDMNIYNAEQLAQFRDKSK